MRLASADERVDHAAVGLSVCIITLNERDNLPRCLESVGGLAQQVLVVDSLSTDGTQQIARAAGAEVLERAFSGHVAQKQFALELAREDWVLCLDADEWLDPELIQAVRQAIAAGTQDGYEVNRRTEYLGGWIDHCGWSPEWRLRLVRRGCAAWRGLDPHDRLELLPGAAPGARSGRLAGRLCHKPYRSLSHHIGKVNHYTDIMADRRFRLGRHPPPLALVLRPPARFLRMYVLRAGFLDGWRGLIVSWVGAFYVFLKYAKLRDRWRRSSSGEMPARSEDSPDAG
ncbi:MAG: glycosyltransferase family 2 protein [Planctomycetota bacterium]